MTRKIVLATANRAYAAGLAAYLRETEPGWETSAFTHESALRLRLQEGGVDALIGDPALLQQASGWLEACLASARWSKRRDRRKEHGRKL